MSCVISIAFYVPTLGRFVLFLHCFSREWNILLYTVSPKGWLRIIYFHNCEHYLEWIIAWIVVQSNFNMNNFFYLKIQERKHYNKLIWITIGFFSFVKLTLSEFRILRTKWIINNFNLSSDRPRKKKKSWQKFIYLYKYILSSTNNVW